jgi:hypothetical protein
LVVFTGLTGSATRAHFHVGAAGTDGGVVWTICNPCVGEYVSGTWPNASQYRQQLTSNHLYINVHTSAHPSGEIRGQVEVPLPEGPPFLGGAILTGNYPAHGLASLSLSEDDDLMYKLIAVNTSSPIIAAHFHMGAEGTDGPAIFTICSPCSGYESGTWMNVSMRRAALASGGVYINVHTEQNTGGEIRGQVMLMLPPPPTPVPSAEGCPAPPMETCCTRILTNATRTLRATLPGPVVLSSVTVWNDDGPDGPPAYAIPAQLARLSLSIGSAGVMTGCALAPKRGSEGYMGNPAPGGMSGMMPAAEPAWPAGFEGWDAVCGARGSVVALSMPAILDGPRPPGRLAVKICVRTDGDGMAPASLWIQG